MKGTLSDQPLAELIREISLRNFSGTLRLEFDRGRAAVYFESGKLVFAACNLRTLRLQEYLSKHQLVAQKEIDRLGTKLSDLDLATALCTGGLIRRDQADALLTLMVADILRVALLWTTGSWDFSERARLGYPVTVNVDVNSLLREAGQRLPLKFVSARFRNPNEIISPAGNASALGNNLLPAENFVLSRLDQPMKLQDLVAVSGLRELDAYRVVYALALSGFVTRQYWHHAFRAETAPDAETLKAQQITPTPTAADVAASELADLEAFLQRLGEANNYYEVIDLSRDAGSADIKMAYYALARKYHPDRFHLQSGTPQHARISSAFARVTQAYETLTDAQLRAEYDASLERARRFSGATKANAQGKEQFDFAMTESGDEADESFNEGMRAMQAGNTKLAVNHLATAARLAPRDARYRAHYGQALGAAMDTRRLAESELQAAVKLEPSNALYRTMLAELYFDLNFQRRAQTELQKALALEPTNAKARTLLRKIEKGRRSR
ncbi:MAG TPA: DUF4388 domain-containing protein [Pyrinomonadaceae bacterium]|nr:DUF4388 domain-containing protein [Pyrinomonadaceae bacterium]